MHEQSIVESILSLVLESAEQANAVRIHKINLVVGEYSGVVEEAVDFYFSFLSRDTIAAGAVLVYSHVPAQLRCRNCATIFKPERGDLHCPACSQQQTDIVSGRELYVDSLEVV